MPDERLDMASDSSSVLHLPARDIQIPASISAEAQAMLRLGPVGAMPPWPAPDDVDAWHRVVAQMDAGALAITAARDTASSGSVVEDRTIAGVPTYWVDPGVEHGSGGALVLNIHGGAWVQGGGALCRAGVSSRAGVFGVSTVAVDYRMPPDHPFPAALDDVVAVYRTLLDDHSSAEIVVAGDSAGANIAAGLMHRLRDEGLPLPGALVLDTPAVDLTGSGDTLSTNDGVDTVLVGDFQATMRLYAGFASLRHPWVSPLFGDFAAGYPPTLLLTGTRDRMLSDTVRMHRALLRAGVPVELHVFEAQGHGGFLGMAPEDQDRADQIRRFIVERIPTSRRGS